MVDLGASSTETDFNKFSSPSSLIILDFIRNETKGGRMPLLSAFGFFVLEPLGEQSSKFS